MPLFKLTSRILIVSSIMALVPISNRGQGIPWYSVPLPVPRGFVDVQSGNVHMEIPLGSMPQRNGDPIGSSIVYDTTYYYYASAAGVWVTTGLGWLPVSGSSRSGGAAIIGSGETCTAFGLNGYPNGSVTFYSGAHFTDMHQTVHSTPDSPNSPPYTTRQVNCYDNFGHFYGNSLDITSYTATDDAGNAYTVSNYNQLQVIAPDGSILADGTSDAYSHDTFPVDPNGNTGTGSQPNLSSGLPAGKSCTQTSPPTYALTSTFTTSSGSAATYTFNCSVLSVSSTVNGTTFVNQVPFLTGLVLPDGTSYSFTYDTGTTGTR